MSAARRLRGDRVIFTPSCPAGARCRNPLGSIAAEIDGAVANQAALGLDTAMGAREFQKFLIAKQREISAVVSTARELGDAKKAVLETLREHYTGSAG